MINRKWEIEAMRRRNKIFAAAIIVVMIIAVVIFYRENNKEWMHYQKDYNEKMAAKLNDPSYLKTPLRIAQIWLPQLNTTDRCISCHLGVSNPLAVDEPQPMTTHPGDFLKTHPVDKFGCTVCHQGDGQVVTVEGTHGVVHHLNRQLLAKEYAQVSCSKCHMELHDRTVTAQDFPGAAAFFKGRDLSYQLGCRGCHLINGEGGTIGPELTGVGSKTELAFFLIHDFQHVEGHHTMAHWIYEHFLDPQKIVPGNPDLSLAATIMPNFGLTEEQAKDLTIYVLGLRNAKVDAIPYEYIAAKKMAQTSSGHTRSVQ
ncbi:MAG: c-type cytochrome [Nitrospirae bacterium]|nr:c-type cytochrome [Nitrospirota bacterium]